MQQGVRLYGESFPLSNHNDLAGIATLQPSSGHDDFRWSGLWTDDLQLKPWGKVFSEFAREVVSQPQKERPFPAEIGTRLPDRKAMLTDPQKTYGRRLLTTKPQD